MFESFDNVRSKTGPTVAFDLDLRTTGDWEFLNTTKKRQWIRNLFKGTKTKSTLTGRKKRTCIFVTIKTSLLQFLELALNIYLKENKTFHENYKITKIKVAVVIL